MDISGNKGNVTAIMVAIATVLGGFVCAVTGASAPHQGNPSIKRGRFLLLDDRIVEQTKNARLAVGKVQKSKRNPLFSEDKPWEVRFDNLYANVIYDQQEKLYECWYSPFRRARNRLSRNAAGHPTVPRIVRWVSVMPPLRTV